MYSKFNNNKIFNEQSILSYIKKNNYKGWDPYDFFNTKLLGKFLKSKKLNVILTQLNRLSKINFRPLLRIPKVYNSKAMGLILSALINLDQNNYDEEITYVYRWLLKNKSDWYDEYSIGFTFDIALKGYQSLRSEPSLVISLFVMYGFIGYYKSIDKNILKHIVSFNRLINSKIPKYEDDNILWYSYNFEKVNEIYNATALIGKYLALLYEITDNKALLEKLQKILNYLSSVQREDGSWAYGKNVAYSDGFHTAFILEAMWHMRKHVDDKRYSDSFTKGLKHYIKYFFSEEHQPFYFHPTYHPKDIRKFIITTDIRDCAMAIILFSRIGDIQRAKKVYDWTITNMYNSNRGYFYYCKNSYWTNKIEFIRWQAWMLYAISIFQNYHNE